MADARDASACPLGSAGAAGEMHRIHRQGHVAANSLDQRKVGKAGNEEAVAAGIGISLAAFDRLLGA